MSDTRPAYRGGGYGFPNITGQYGAGRRRVYWEEGGLIGRCGPYEISQAEERRTRHEELFPYTPLPERGTRRSMGGKIQEVDFAPADAPVTFLKALLTGVGIATGFAIFRKVVTAKR